jgi:uncharacterized repeat protein (TIGR04138 family)
MDFYEKVLEITKADPRYKADAYEFLMQALWFTQKKLNKTGHVSGVELLAGLKEFGLEQYGPMSRAVFEHWGITSTEDFGQIVFNMVNNGLLGKSDADSVDDFKNVYDFKDAFDIFKVVKNKRE